MFVDARTIPFGTKMSADLCIVGGGAAGITIALEFLKQQYTVCLLESGGFKRDDNTQALYDGESVGVPYDSLTGCRSRFFGGSTNCWVGWCRPLDPLDFETRSWIPESGWPLSYEELIPYYQRAQSHLNLDAFDYLPLSWSRRPGFNKSSFLQFASRDVHSVVNQLTPETRLAKCYSSSFRSAPNIKILLHANAVELEAASNGRSVRGVCVATLSGTRFFVAARAVVLASGGIENARLLLASRRVHASGLGNQNDLVGRYFMDHPRIRSLQVKLSPLCERHLYDHSLALVKRRLKLPHLPIAVHLSPTQKRQYEAGLSNSRTYFVSSSFEELSGAKAALDTIRKGARRKGGLGGNNSLPKLVRRVGSGIGALADFTVCSSLSRRPYYLETVIEPIPRRDSRVMLSTERDQLGQNRAKLDWRLSEADRLNFTNSVNTVRVEMENQHFMHVINTNGDPSEFWPSEIQWCWHHMGTTRMHPNPCKGVVDANGRIHEMSNAFVAGSSVFPTAGGDTPTLTIVALAVRLSQHLQSLLGSNQLTHYI
jgi:choline dehydrogenase-like flavoprotein